MHHIKHRTMAVAVITAFYGLTTNAQTNTSPASLEEVVVWGTQITASSLNIDEDRLSLKQADHVSDLLRTIPGIDVGGAHSLNQRITIRSMDDKDLRITIDGANQNTYMYHHMGNLQIHADILESVDINIGTNSVVNGGLGGAVRFETKTADQLLQDGQRFGARLQGSWSNNAHTGWAITGYGKISNAVDFILYHNSIARDNFEVGGGKIKDADGKIIAGTDGKVRGLKGDLDDTLLKLGWTLTDSHRVELGVESYSDDGNYSYRPDMGLATDLAIGTSLDSPLTWPTEFSRDTITLNYEGEIGNTELRLTLFDNKSELSRDESAWQHSTAIVRGRPITGWAGHIEGNADNKGLNLIADTLLQRQQLTWGFDWIDYDTHYKAAYLSGTIDSSTEDATAISLFVQDRIELTERLALIPGIRYDSYDMRSTLVKDTFSETSGALALEYQALDTLLLKVSTTQLFKAPEVAEVFTGAGLFDKPNPNIKAETGYNSEFSLAYGDEVLGADYFSAGFTLFKTDIDDYIYDYAGRNLKDNIGDMAIRGVEAYIGYELGSMSALFSYSNAESKLDASTQYARFNTARIDRQQGDTYSLNVDYDISAINLSLHWDLLHVGSLPAGVDLDGAGLDNSKSGFTVHNVSARWTPAKLEGLTVVAGIDNVNDTFYASQSSRTGTSAHPLFGTLYLLDYEPGRNYKITLSYDL